jgi:hypothetical protein
MEIRALAIAIFYAIGTGIGGVAAPVYLRERKIRHEGGQVAIVDRQC